MDCLVLLAVNAFLYAANPRLLRRYWLVHKRLPNIACPKRYSERMFWRKLVDHNPQFVLFSDKLASMEYLKRLCPDLPIPKTLWVGHDVDAIPDAVFSRDVFVKANHGCDFNHRVRAKRPDRTELRAKACQWLASTHGQSGGQWAYSKVEPKLFVEEAVGDAEVDLIEFNLRACNGVVILGSVLGKCKTPHQWAVYLDPKGQPTHGVNDVEGSPVKILPEGLEITEPYLRAVEFSRKLSVGVDYARFDFLWNGTELFGGEVTIYPAGGIADPRSAAVHALTLSGWDLMQAHFLKSKHGGVRGIYADALKRFLRRNCSAAG